MTLLYMEGFESVVDNPDLTKRGWTTSTSITGNGNNALTVPSRSGVAGRGLMLRGPYSAGLGLPMAAATSADFGMFNTGQSIHSLWQSGGFAVGFNATFNKASQVQIAAGYTYQIVYDGAVNYWALALIGATWSVASSTDLVNWTPVATPPAGLNSMCKIVVVGSGSTATIAILNWVPNAITSSFYSTNMGGTWTLFPTVSSDAPSFLIANKSSTAPFIYLIWESGGMQIYYSATIGGAFTRIGALLNSGFSGIADFVIGNGRYSNGVILLTTLNQTATYSIPITAVNFWQWCLDSTDPTNAANWTTSPTSSIGAMNDIAYFPVTGLWYAVGVGGIATSSQTGTTLVPKGPFGAWVTVLATSTAAVWSIATNGTLLVAVGQDPVNTTLAAIWTSTNGTTWTKANRFILSAASSTTGNAFTNVIWDGVRFIITGAQNSNVIATSPDGIAWTATYYPDYTEVVGTDDASCLGIFSGTIASGVYVPYSTSSSADNGVGVVASAVSAGNRTVSALYVGGNGGVVVETPTAVIPVTALSHYYEIIATTFPGSVNAFTFQIAIDGVIIGQLPAGTGDAFGQFALAGDTTGIAQLLINLPRSGNWTVIDDIYVTNFTTDAAGNTGPLGIVNIVPHMPTSDVQEQLTLNGSAASHAAEVAGALSNSEGSVISFTIGAKDIYASSNVIPANFKVQAIQAEAYFSKAGSTGSNCSVGIVSGAAETDSAPVVALTSIPTFASLLLELDPNTGLPWTAAAAAAAKISITKVT